MIEKLEEEETEKEGERVKEKEKEREKLVEKGKTEKGYRERKT